jgi:hypothetical protein
MTEAAGDRIALLSTESSELGSAPVTGLFTEMSPKIHLLIRTVAEGIGK